MFDIISFHNLFRFACYFLACASAYRAGAFVHEIVHQRNNKKFDRKFVWFWNLTIGAIALFPSPDFNNHLKHHAIGIFGTAKDPQYPLLKKHGQWQLKEFLLLFFVFPLGMPLMNLFRVLISPWVFLFGSSRLAMTI